MAGNGEWKTVRLSDVYDFSSGLSKPRSEFGFGHGFLTFKDVLDNFFVPDTLSALVNSTEKERERCSVKRGDVFLTRTSETQEDLGMSCVALMDYELATFNGFTKRLRPKPDTNIVPEYAAYYFRGPKFRREVTAMSSLSTRASLNNSMLDTLSIVLPPVEVQSAIGRVLKALDAKIELNRRMNETLESLARSLFKSWFVDFDPVRAKMDGRDPGLPPAIAVLFPDSFEHQNGDLIPAGWKPKAIGDLADIKHGFAFKGEFFRTAPTSDVLLTPGNFSIGGGFKGGKFKYYDGPVPEDFILCTGDLLVTMTDLSKMGDTLGYPALVPNAHGTRFLHNQRLGKVLLKGDAGVGPAFLYQTFCLPTYRHHVLGSATGSTVKHTSPDRIKSFELPVPDNRVAAAFEKSALSFQTQIVANMNESETLAALRNTLLPKLLSGELCLQAAITSIESKLSN